MKKLLFAMPIFLLTLSCTSGAPPAEEAPTPSARSLTESEIGLAPGTAFEQPPQAPIGFNRVDPGESELRPRPNAEFPPVIPHSIADLETITLTENSCLECHDPAVAVDMGAVALPRSHFVDLRRSPQRRGNEVEGSRWVCTSCHVEQTDAEPLVANSPNG
jgi:cytochrome c-type protein NapB